MRPTLLSVRDARKSFGNVRALDGVTLEIRTGELLGLLGPNGAGKTTLVRAVAGRVRLDAGSVEFSVARGSAPLRLGVVPQEIALYPLLTARENLEVFGRLQGLTGSALAAKVDWALEWTGLRERSREPVQRFSGGMKRRLNIACGVLHDPAVVLLDEPTVGVDPQSRERIYQMLENLRRSGVTLLLTTHALEEAESRCERIVILDHGRVVSSGTLSELVERTVGTDRRVTIRIDRRLETLPPGFEDGAGGTELRAQVRDVAGELPRLLQALRAEGRRVEDVEVRAPSLQAVFLHLTGRELRE
jgi:ABC-2 type transport system ATP-binding protein